MTLKLLKHALKLLHAQYIYESNRLLLIDVHVRDLVLWGSGEGRASALASMAIWPPGSGLAYVYHAQTIQSLLHEWSISQCQIETITVM